MSVPSWVYQFRGYLVTPPMVLAFFSYHLETEGDFIWPLGIFLFLIGVALRTWAQQHLHYRLKTHKILTITGPYLFVRNPIYIGNLLLLVGATVLSRLLWLVPLTLLYCVFIYSLVVRYEEAHLLSKYGEPYQSYLHAVSRWFPRVLPNKKMGLVNEYFLRSVVAESHCFLLIFPYILKDMIG